MKTYATKAKDIERKWQLIDADGKTLGRLCVRIATLLMGKNKAMFARNIDTGDFVVVINADKIKVTGKKLTDKLYYRHSGYPGGLVTETLEYMLENHPTRVIEHAVKGMLPRNRLGRAMFKKLKVYAGGDHPHQAQLAGSQQSTERSSNS